ncbi:MAG TPA: methylenetetrahydrofolate--tRNA-(uracil(54)-C(5))-methyltransferase (FADH(2)-oxidizing) TrmFO, partial [Ruminococcaceae bacterium]|nr:methylenetetrahydrofolate--tRNA-(uracil(54)-C(5))-methyltransferase (FADH(2)-oxidizing) TrmFO [Oscillospiraceae bacterium]
IGAGLAGCEAAWQLAKAGISVQLYEMKPKKYSPAHHYSGFAELVCSNSLKAARIGSAAGMLKAEMRLFDSLVLRCAEESAVAAGGALAVDRTRFSDLVTEAIRQNEHIRIFEEEVTEIPEEPVIIATGPLTSEGLSEAIRRYCGTQYLGFFDAAAPIVSAESLDQSRVFMAARYGRGDADYVNCPFTREEYEAFYDALIHAESAPLHEFDRRDFKVYEGCMPIEVMAKRGADTLRYGPLKPVGLTDPNTGKRPYAVVQLRRENAAGSMYNLVGFQTNLKFPEQKRVFSMIPGLENAEFYRYGVMHRNTFLNSPKLLNFDFSLRTAPLIAFAGQMTGVEGYIESASSGIMAGYYMAKKLHGEEIAPLPTDCMMGALASYISNPVVEDFQPMGCNMGILPDIGERIRDKALRYTKVAERGINALKSSLVKG